MQKSLYFFFSLLIVLGCNSEPVFPVEPSIEFVDIFPLEVREITDSVTITVSFQDGDGDLGDVFGGTKQSIIVKESRDFLPDSLRTSFFSMPDLSTDSRNPSIQGNIKITMQSPLIFPVNLQTQEIFFTVTIVDQAGNESNSVKTLPITVTK